ncbi:unnamed protein product [Candidula unifasciata]|uniref:G-protein coupled receptors family 1 profile domain-containing protein n=1 Tax=Candidula unifasciata TaxID=100452 RepID=A0A8S3YPZ6_9EUPU|nr:unnamed protein product [Candidula unifasciata]
MSMLNLSVIEDVTAGPAESTGAAMDKDTEKIVVSVILSIFCVFGTVGNALAFLIYYRKREKGTSTIFILSLAVTDFLTCLINLPYTIVSLLLDYRLEYDILCTVFLFMSTFSVRLSAANCNKWTFSVKYNNALRQRALGLMGLRAVEFTTIVFYMFYINSVINPVIYAFMNRTFRDDLFQLVKNCFRH